MTHVISLFCDPGGIQTHDLQNRNLMLYSAKLQGRQFNCDCEDSNNLPRNNCPFDKKANCFTSFISIFKTKHLSLPILRKQMLFIATKITTKTDKTKTICQKQNETVSITAGIHTTA